MAGISESHQWLVEAWAHQFTTVIETMTGEAPDVTYDALSADAADPAPFLWYTQPFSIGSALTMWAGASEESWQQIGQRVLTSAGVEDGDPESIRSTYLEIVHQVLAGVAGVLTQKAGREVSCLEGQLAPPPDNSDSPRYSFEIHLGDVMMPVVAVFPASLDALTESFVEEHHEPIEKPKAAKAAPPPEPAKPNSIDLLLDVELPVAVSFGRAQLPLKDVIKLTTGSIVELNRAVSEPVDVIVNNCVIARGEVVVVEGNFGIRIRQVISRQDRLRTLY